MNVQIALLILFAIYISRSHESTYFILNTEDPEKPGYCHFTTSTEDRNISFYMRIGEVKRHPLYCQSIRCSKDFTITSAGCGTISAPKHCVHVPGDLSKPHPRCCDDYLC